MPGLQRLFPFLSWPRPTRELLRGEAMAGLTVGLMVVPQGVAYAALAGMPLVTGIYASMLPALVAIVEAVRRFPCFLVSSAPLSMCRTQSDGLSL